MHNCNPPEIFNLQFSIINLLLPCTRRHLADDGGNVGYVLSNQE